MPESPRPIPYRSLTACGLQVRVPHRTFASRPGGFGPTPRRLAGEDGYDGADLRRVRQGLGSAAAAAHPLRYALEANS